MKNFQKRFRDYIRDKGLIETGSCKNIVAGISGGMDSVCLLLLLKETFEKTDVKITAVHINHNLRAEADRDENFVKNLCKEQGVDLRVFLEDVKGLAAKEGIGLEEAGRKLRYERFAQVAKEHGDSVKIAVAHHMNDQAETVLFNLLRGSNLAGLTGIQEKQIMNGIEVIRPLLFAKKEEIEEFLSEREQAYVTDATNAETDYTRNRIRHNIIPEMAAVNEGAVEHIAKTAGAVSEAEEFLKEKTDEAYGLSVDIKGGEYFIDTEFLNVAGPFLSKRIIYRAIGEIRQSLKDVTRAHVESVISLAGNGSGKRVNLPFGIEAVKEGRYIVLKEIGKELGKAGMGTGISRAELERGCEFALDSGERINFEVIHVTDENRSEIIKKNQYTKAFDYDRISDSIFLGPRTGEEKIQLQQGEKSLSRFFIDQKIPRDRRENYLILKQGNEVIWVLGLRISEKYKITDATERALRVSITGGRYGQD